MAELYEEVWSDVGRPMHRPGIEGARARCVPDTIHENMHWRSGFCFNSGSVIGHGIGGTNFPDIMARLAKMQDPWVSDDRPVCHHPISRPVKAVMAKRSTYVDVTYYREFLT